VDIKVLFHIHRVPQNQEPQFEAEHVYTTKATNDFWAFYENYRPYITFDNMNLISPAKYSHYCVEQNQVDSVGLKFLSESMKEAGMYIRELVFEEMRAKEFHELPSRRSCIWLTSEQQVDFWLDRLNDGKSNYYWTKLECEGIFHTGNQSYLNSDLFGYSEYCSNARAYWLGEHVDIEDNNEVIFEGKIKVLEIGKCC
jgi:hypothetical protein